jgi:hypothetical protein
VGARKKKKTRSSLRKTLKERQAESGSQSQRRKKKFADRKVTEEEARTNPRERGRAGLTRRKKSFPGGTFTRVRKTK